MFDGMAQSLDRETGRLATVTFGDFTYDVAALIAEGRARNYDVRELPTALLIRADDAMAEEMSLPWHGCCSRGTTGSRGRYFRSSRR
jgi:lipopolysaccharide export system permease protein